MACTLLLAFHEVKCCYTLIQYGSEQSVQDSGVQPLFRSKMVVNSGDVGASGFGDVPLRRLRKAFLGEEAFGNIKDAHDSLGPCPVAVSG